MTPQSKYISIAFRGLIFQINIHLLFVTFYSYHFIFSFPFGCVFFNTRISSWTVRFNFIKAKCNCIKTRYWEVPRRYKLILLCNYFLVGSNICINYCSSPLKKDEKLYEHSSKRFLIKLLSVRYNSNSDYSLTI